MTVRPILFNGDMIRAIFSGQKLVTRRLPNSAVLKIQAGDKLWVRETWQGLSFGDYLPTRSKVCDLRYKATESLGDVPADVRGYPWRPSLHMPKWASRLTLNVTNVSHERVQNISHEDCIREGVSLIGDPLVNFITLWNSVAPPEKSWDENPEVVAIYFEVIHKNVDEVSIQ